MNIDQEILTARTLRYFPKSSAKKYLVASAKKDLELIKKTQNSVDDVIALGILQNNQEYCDFKGLLRDCRNQIELIIKDPLAEKENQYHNKFDCENPITNGKWSLSEFVFCTRIYDNCDFQFIKLWEKLIYNTKNCLETMGTKVSWGTAGMGGHF